MQNFTGRINNQIEAVRNEIKRINLPPDIFTVELCYPNDYNQSIDGKIVAIKADMAAPYKEYAAAEPFTACDQKNVRKFLDYKNVVLAAQLMGNGELHFVTWEYSYNRAAVGQGHYFGTNYEAAREDFAIRSGLIRESNVLTKKQVNAIKSACEYRYENDEDLTYDAGRLLQDTIEHLNESINEREDRPGAEKRVISKHRNDAR